MDRTEFTTSTRGRHISGPRSRACLTQSFSGAGAGSMSRATRWPAWPIRESSKRAVRSARSEATNAVDACGCGSCYPIAAEKLRASNSA